MRDVSIIGIGQTKVGEHWELALRDLAAESILAAMDDAGIETADALYVGNMLSGVLAKQEQLGAAIADYAGLRGIEALKVEAADSSGASALHVGYQAVAGGLHDIVIVTGVEKMTELLSGPTEAAMSMAGESDREAAQGASYVTLNALMMQRYMHVYGLEQGDFAAFSINAHRNAAHNPCAMFPNPISEKAFRQAKMIATPINLMDSAPLADGAATVILCPSARAHEFKGKPVRILASTVATDSVALSEREDPLWLDAAYRSAREAYARAGIGPQDVDAFELHDAFTILATLSLEACGFTERGTAVKLAKEGQIALNGRIPIQTMGGLKARGHPVGATGIYQIVELVLQLRGEAGANQVDCRIGMAQSLGGTGSTAVTHILTR